MLRAEKDLLTCLVQRWGFSVCIKVLNCTLFFTDESGDEETVSQTDKTELQNTLRTLSSKVEDLSTCNDLIAKHGTALQRSLSELETLKLPAESNEKIKQVNERATLFRITSNAMINVSVLPAIGCVPPRLKSLSPIEAIEYISDQNDFWQIGIPGSEFSQAESPGFGCFIDTTSRPMHCKSG